MIALLIHSLELILISLFGYLSFTVVNLFNNDKTMNDFERPPTVKLPYKSHAATNSTPTTYSRVESITSAQIFAGLQLLEVKRTGINLFSSREDWIDNGVSYYLLGAASAITAHFDCSGNDKDDVMRFLLTKNLKISEERAEKYISLLYQENEQEIEQGAFHAGITAAKTWLTNKFIPEEQSLLNNLHSWGFVA